MKKMLLKEALLAILGIALFITGGCSKDHGPVAYTNPIDSGDSSIPPVPRNLVTKVGDKTVHLTWQVSDTTDVRWYRIARKDSLEGVFALIDSVTLRSYVDRGLKNGRTYRYRVCVVSKDGFVGAHSQEVSATPNDFTISINDGHKYTTSLSVTLTISAPGGASLMMLANDSLFTEASWEPFMMQKSWLLPPEDGQKTVYLKIRDLDDNEASGFHGDSILLDTRVGINNLAFSPMDSVFWPGDLIHFTMETGETYGQAEVDIGSALAGKKLFDDGTHGDGVADDGTYELSFVVPSGLQVIEAPVRGRFTDEAGNIAEEVTAVQALTIQARPEAVQLYPPTRLGTSNTALHLTWSQNQDDDFTAYRLYRSETAGVDTAHDRTLVTEISTQSTTSFDDMELEENHIYYYKIYVYDEYGLSSGSNEVTGTTGENQAPQSVTLVITSVQLSPDDSTTAQIELKWTRSQETDFDHYMVYRDLTSPVSPSSTPIDLINDSQITTAVDRGLQLSTQYFYRVYVCDEGGLCTGSNEVETTTPSGPQVSPSNIGEE